MSDNVEWFRRAGYGMMIHWGLYSLLAGEYRGRSSSAYAEWIQSRFRIPNEEYGRLAQAFNPICFDADRIVDLAKRCGMQYLVVTAKHHDGFALYRSRTDAYNVYDATPFHRDVIGELAQACRKAGLRFGLYYSQDLDWHDPDGGGYMSNDIETAGSTWDNSWDFTGPKDYSRAFERKIMPQIREIMSGYGDISIAWFDVPMTLTDEQSRVIYETVKELQPGCLINSRLGNGRYDYVSLGDNEIPASLEAKEQAERKIDSVDYNSITGFKPSRLGLYESAGTINDSWGFSYHDHNWKSPRTIHDYKSRLNSMGINYLLNIGLDPLGRVPMAAEQTLLAVREMDGQAA
ncbi:alpha-L-fucosidase [Bifidobacterium xylocopae]|uniref:alpha-L-fucosidase n=1 Tax=Bifidobacterium xylocopae TaxID=2493119 RepID=A0A366KEF3_9BIFI|nr:alpha-L-fucosidase [Bifidobacterium xylocopae]RBQ00106.1 alpha-L-fucosidase [Bifidobacterium xylocopae]